ncbi:predicted protein [Sclerotinia sclerotiorum 1980 UF-70]|uniref:Uncharacterized protein n=2 Tax=Sclerotinia sclerotiorum (strain ATCC 18683 / 1980 / Ss-1) TaxID=665079 RepID=A7F0Q7_SCLS1|nr:predicted protein [Sclerotinia sclerotiorum 1980 UF-70]APA14009.1 hypothetical protein sscle_12g087790 [Sclerotinia sclerotiorum 1980 UF-70]EDN95299.1 predicted protein [Sclerotinia sclerotiorum 1980 UF-70]
MHIWAGSGSSSNGKETIRRRTRTPQKTIRGLKKRKSSASIGLGMDGSCSNGEVGNASLSPAPSPRRDSGIDCVMAFEPQSEDSIHSYDVGEDMVKSLNVGSLDSDSGKVNTIGRIEDGLKKLRRKKSDRDLHDESQVSSTSRKSKGRGVPLKELNHALGNGADDLCSSLGGLSRMMESNKRIFGAIREREERLAATTDKDSNGNVLNMKSSLGIKQIVSKEILQPDVTESIQDNPQHSIIIKGKNGLGKITSTKEVMEHERPDKYLGPCTAEENPKILSTASHSNTSSSFSENDMERVFSERCEQISEPESTDEQPGGENFVSVIESDFDSEREDKAEGIFSVRCEEIFGPESTNEHVGNECSTPDIKPLHTSEDENESQRAFSISCEQVPELDMDGYFGDECLTPCFKSPDNALGISQETIHCNASIVGFSLRVPHLVREARQSLFTSSHSRNTDVSLSSQESMGEITSLKEIEFCASGLKNYGADDDVKSSLEPGVDDSPQIRYERALASVEEFSSNLGSPMSLSMMDNYKMEMDSFMTGDMVESSAGITVDGEAEIKANDGGKFPLFQGSAISSLEPLRQIKVHSPKTKNNENSPSLQDSLERDIKNSEGFSPVHQEVLNSMTPKHSIHYTIREKPDKHHKHHYKTVFKPVSWKSHENGRNLSQGVAQMERNPSRYPAEKRSFSQPNGSCSMSWTGQNSHSSFESDCAEGHGSEEWLLGTEGCSGSEEKMQRFWMKDSKEVVVDVWNVREEMDMEAPTTTCHSIPQIDGQNSPPLLAVDSLVEPVRSPSPRKRLQKVNRSKSPSSANKSSSSSLGKIFQNSRIEGMEGEIRYLRMEVEGLKRMVDELDRELKGVRVREESSCERVGYLGNRMEEVWSAVYGKGWDAGNVGGEGVEWEDKGEVDWTREVRDVGLLRVLGRMKRDGYDEKKRDASDEPLKERGIESCEVDLMVPTSWKPEPKSKITVNDDEDEFENEEFRSLNTPISLEQQASKELDACEDLGVRRENTLRKLLKIKSLLTDDGRTSDEELARLEREMVSLRSEREMAGGGGERCEDRSRMEGDGEFEEMGKEDVNENAKGKAVLGDLLEDKDSREDNGDEQVLKYNAEHFHKEHNPDAGFEDIDRNPMSIDQEGGLKNGIREDRKGKQKDGMGAEKKCKRTTWSWRPDAAEMEGLFEVGISRGNEGDDGRIRGKEIEEDEKEQEKKRVESLISYLLARQEIDKVMMEEWWEVERERDLEEIRGLREMVEELKGLVLSGKGNGNGNKDEDELHDCDKLGCGCYPSGGGNGGRGRNGGKSRKNRKSGKANNVANMRKRDICDFADDGWDEEEGSEEERDGGNGNGNGNGRGFWDWVGGGILWRQD